MMGLGLGPMFQLGMGALGMGQEWLQNLSNNELRQNILDQTLGIYGALGNYTTNTLEPLRNQLINEYGGVDRATLAGLQRIGGQQMGWFNNIAGNLLSGQTAEYDALQRGFNERAGTVLSGLEETRGNMMNYLQGAGTQEKADALQRWREKNAADQMNVANRGMAGTTVGSTLATGNVREQEAEMRRINERLQQQRLGVEGQMGVAKANMQAGLMGDALNFGAQSAANRLGLQQQLGMQGLGLQDALSREQLSQKIAGMERPLQLWEGYGQQLFSTRAGLAERLAGLLQGIPVPANTNYGFGNMAQIMSNIQSANALERYGKNQQNSLFGNIFGASAAGALGGMVGGLPLMAFGGMMGGGLGGLGGLFANTPSPYTYRASFQTPTTSPYVQPWTPPSPTSQPS